MVEQYRKANDRIHVPEELMQPDKGGSQTGRKKAEGPDDTEIHLLLAACFCLVCLGVHG